MTAPEGQGCPSCDRDLSYPGKPGHECYTYAEHAARIKANEVVREVLADHIWIARQIGASECWSANDRECGERFSTGGQWRAHVATLIADRLAVTPPTEGLI